MAVLIDTAPLIALERGVVLDRLDDAIGEEERAISVVTASELLHGVHRADGSRAVRRRAWVEHVLASMVPVPITAAVARVHAEIWAAVQSAGTPVGAHDLWIAATAVSHGWGVVTANVRDFGRVPGLRVVPFEAQGAGP